MSCVPIRAVFVGGGGGGGGGGSVPSSGRKGYLRGRLHWIRSSMCKRPPENFSF